MKDAYDGVAEERENLKETIQDAAEDEADALAGVADA